MGKKETRINLNRSDVSYVVEMEPLKDDSDEVNKGPWKRQEKYQDKTESNVESCGHECESKWMDFYNNHKKRIHAIAGAVCFIGYMAFFIVACVLDFERARDLFIVTMSVLFICAYYLLKFMCGDGVYVQCFMPLSGAIEKSWSILRWIVYVTLLALIGLWLGLDTAKDPRRLVSAGGLIVYLILSYLLSKHRKQINWRTVLWGIGMQFVLGIIILRTKVGLAVFSWFGQRVAIFLQFSDHGAQFLFGNSYMDHPFAFKVLPIVVFFSAFIYMIYYLGAMQPVISRIAWFMQVTMGTSAAESFNTAGNIFIGQTEAPLLIRPFLPDLTMSELHAVMTGGFATLAGSVMGAYMQMGVSPTHILSASVMSAPAALAVSKLMYPETEEPKSKTMDQIEIDKGTEGTVIEAFSAGASMSIGLVANIAVMLISFVAMLAFVNAILQWLGSMVGCPQLTFQFICAYVCMPFAYIMGIEWNDSFAVGELLGIKTFLNEFLAYDELSKYIKNRRQDLDGIKISLRSEAIATYALCGFSNIASIGIQIGGISAICPSRRGDIARIAVRALIAGIITCMLKGCIAGILFEESMDDSLITAALNVTKTCPVEISECVTSLVDSRYLKSHLTLATSTLLNSTTLFNSTTLLNSTSVLFNSTSA